MFFSRWKVKPTQASPHLRTLLSCEKEGTSDRATPARSQGPFAKWKKSASHRVTYCHSIHITFSKWRNYGDGGRISALRGGNRGREGKGREVMWLEVVTQRSVVVMGQVASWLVVGTQIYTYDKTACNCRRTKGYTWNCWNKVGGVCGLYCVHILLCILHYSCIRYHHWGKLVKGTCKFL